MYDYSYSTTVASAGSAILLGFGVIVIAVLMFIAWCRIFDKAGLPWERMFVPFCGVYTQYSVANAAGLFWATFILSIVTALTTAVIPVLGAILTVATCICVFIFYIVHCVKLATVFGRGGGFAAGLVFLHPLFIMILGFGKSTYYLFSEN